MSNVPKLRFKEFSGKNRVQKFKEIIVSNTYGPRFNANDYADNGNVKTIRGTDVSLDGSIKYNQVPTAQLDEKFIKSHTLEDGDLVMITTADCGLTGIFEEQNEKYICSAYAVKITLDKSLTYPYYFKYFFQTTLAKNEVNKYIRKATVANLPASDILRFSHRIPSKQEQEKIASFLISVDIKIEQLTKKEELLLSYKKGVMQKIFSGEIRFKADDGSEFCEWEEKNIEEVVREYNDKTTQNDQYPILSSTKDGIFLQSEYFDKQTASADNTGYKIVPKGYFTYRSMSDTGSFTFNQQNLINIGIVSPAYPVFKSNNKVVERFLEITLNNSPEIIQQILMLKEGGTRLALGFNKFKKLCMSLPCIEEQTKIANFLSSIDSKIEQVQKQLNSTKEFKKALLQQMFV